MKKIPFICLILAICLMFALPSTALAVDGTAMETDSHIFLTNPIAIASVGNKIFVADNLESNLSVIFCFDVSGEAPIKIGETEFDKQIVNVAEVNGQLAVITKDEIALYTTTSNSLVAVEDGTYKISGAVDVTYGRVQFGNDSYLDTVSYISDQKAQYLGTSGWRDMFSDKPNNAKAATFFNGYFYYAFDNKAQRHTGTADMDDQFNKMSWSTFAPTGILTYEIDGTEKLALFDSKKALSVNLTNYSVGNSIFAQGVTLGGDIVDVAFAAGKIFLLNSNHRVEIFEENTDHETFKPTSQTIGTDTISISTPTDFTGFTMAKSLGYPTNIIYKTADGATSVTDIVTDCKDQFIILDFDGADSLKYYYVMYGNKFGWVRKSVSAEVPQDDAKIQVIDNSVGAAGVKHTAQFISGRAVYINKLPLTGEQYLKEQFNQSFPNMQEFTFLQKFEERKTDGTTVTWFYIEYGDSQRGFINDGTFGNISNVAVDNDRYTCTDKKINASLFEAVKIYLTEEMIEGQEIGGEKLIKLYSGTHVNAILDDNGKLIQKNGATYVQVRYNDKLEFGWIPSSTLIDVDRLTTNSIVGLSLLGAAIVLGITLLVVFVERRKRKLKQSNVQDDDVEA